MWNWWRRKSLTHLRSGLKPFSQGYQRSHTPDLSSHHRLAVSLGQLLSVSQRTLADSLSVPDASLPSPFLFRVWIRPCVRILFCACVSPFQHCSFWAQGQSAAPLFQTPIGHPMASMYLFLLLHLHVPTTQSPVLITTPAPCLVSRGRHELTHLILQQSM